MCEAGLTVGKTSMEVGDYQTDVLIPWSMAPPETGRLPRMHYADSHTLKRDESNKLFFEQIHMFTSSILF